MTSATPIVHKTRTHMVVEALREMILSGQIKAGEPLRQSQLAESLNVSRIPVREALLQLEAEGLVKFEAHKGATATELSAAQAEELFHIRCLLEPDLLARSIPHLTEEQLAHSAALLVELDEALEASASIHTWADLNKEFHLSLYVGADRPQTLELVQTLNTHADRYIRLHLMRDDNVRRAKGEHKTLLDACRDKDIDRAVRLLREHIAEAGAEIVALIGKRHV
ncbi:GntR family transcriptional regulator [Gallaecimonas sp. GXIMD4217]|uniref:GntR family transcriptional regulator n=1 Tax=Gallaecimonas sp. GXIMD4217 TaxID=3131927 RepID=UPI00311B1E01